MLNDNAIVHGLVVDEPPQVFPVPLAACTIDAWNWFEFWAGGAGNDVTKAKIAENSTTVSASRRIVATTSETARSRVNLRRGRSRRFPLRRAMVGLDFSLTFSDEVLTVESTVNRWDPLI